MKGLLTGFGLVAGLAQGHLHLLVGTVADEVHCDLVAWLEGEEGINVRMGRIQGHAAQAGDDVTGFQAGCAGRAAGRDRSQVSPILNSQVVSVGDIGGDGLKADAPWL